MKKIILVSVFLLAFCSSAFAQIFTVDTGTTNFDLPYWTRGKRGVDPRMNLGITSMDSLLYSISTESGSISADLNAISNTVVILSNDAITWTGYSTEIGIISTDVNAISDTVVILSNDSSSYLLLDGTRSMTGTLDMNSNVIDNALQVNVLGAVDCNSIDATTVGDDILGSITADTIEVRQSLSCDTLSVDGLLMIAEAYSLPVVAPLDTQVLSYDSASGLTQWGYVAGGGGGAVSAVAEGTVSPLEIAPTTGNIWVTIASADSGVDGYIRSHDWTSFSNDTIKTDIISSDVQLISATVVIMSEDAVDWEATTIQTDITSADVGLISATVVIMSNDAVDWEATTIQTDITSADVGLISDTVVIMSADIADISNTVVIISNDAIDWIAKANIISADVQLISTTVVILSYDVNAISNTVVIMSNDIAGLSVGASQWTDGGTFIYPTEPTDGVSVDALSIDNTIFVNNQNITDFLETRQVGFFIDGGGSEITTGAGAWISISYDATITHWEMTGDPSSSISLGILVDGYDNFPPDNDDRIEAAAPPNLTAQIKNNDAGLAGWTTSISKGDYIRVSVDSVDACEFAELILYLKER